MPNRPRVVIVGGGFGGLYAAKRVARYPVDVMLFDRQNHHLFQPLLYQVATAGLSPADIASPIREILNEHHNVSVFMGEVVGFDLPAKRVLLHSAGVPFDYLILAAGSSHSYFGHDEYAKVAPGLKTIDDAIGIRRRVLLAYEVAERQAACCGQHEPINFFVVGGGPTGVEMAGTLAEVARRALPGDFRHIDPKRTRTILVEAVPRILTAYPEDLGRSAEQQLKRLGVEVWTDTRVTNVLADKIVLGDKTMPSALTIWAAGVAANPLGRALGVPVDKAGRVDVESDCSVPGHKDVFVIGDMAAFKEPDGKLLPGLAPVAMQQGRFVADAIGRDMSGQPRGEFRYHDKGSLATIGRAAAVGTIGRFKVKGLFAWLAWLFVHVMYLAGFRNRVAVLFNWAYSYTTMQRGARLITGNVQLPPVARPSPQEEPGEPVQETDKVA